LDPPQTVAPLNFDTRHVFNASIDIRFASAEGPRVGSIRPLENVGLNVLVQAATGRPYTPVQRKTGFTTGTRNSSRLRSTGTIDLRADRRFAMSDDASISVFAWIVNVFDWENIYNVYRTTGAPDDNGFLSSPEGQEQVNAAENPDTAALLIMHSLREPEFYGPPRQVHIGLRLTF